jgi:hypothetical protein
MRGSEGSDQRQPVRSDRIDARNIAWALEADW